MMYRSLLPLSILIAGCGSTEELGSISSEVGQLSEDVDNLSVQVTELEGTHTNDVTLLQTSITLVQADILKLQDAVTDLNTTMEELRNSVDTQMEELRSSVDTQIEELRSSVDTQIEELNNSVDMRLTALESGQTNLQTTVTALQAASNATDAAVATLTSEVSALNNALQAAIDAGDMILAEDIDALDTRLTTLEDREVPIGTVIDWYRPTASTSLPDGWVLCDGSLINHPGSVFDRQNAPNLRDRFTRGVSDMSVNTGVGVVGGSDTHDHDTNTSHTHTGYTSQNGEHNHLAFFFDGGGQEWYDGVGQHMDWGGDWIGDYGSGTQLAPLAMGGGDGTIYLYTDVEPNHDHSVYTYTGGGWVASTTENNVPVYVGMVKILRAW